jgi:DUF4097 and DUF4098 domain-containing protein YvlB
MRKFLLTKLSLPVVISLCFLFGAGCIPSAEYERVVNLSEPLGSAKAFEAETHNGSVTVNGAATNMCDVTATITARADTEENAKKLADKVRVWLDTSGPRIAARIEKPGLAGWQHVGVAFDVKITNHINLDLVTHNGSVEIADITGEVEATTHNGAVTTRAVTGNHRLTTHNGRISCHRISGDIELQTHNGSVDVVYADNAPTPGKVDVVTHNGGIDFTSPPNLSAKADIATHNGSIHTALPITVVGEVSKRELRGTIGSGQGRLHLKTHNGSITIK